MVKDTELRKGNYLYFNPNGTPFVKRIKELRKNDLICCGEEQPDQRLGLYYTNGDVAPIPLTPEWLERCGFVKRDSKTAGVDLYGLGNITIEHEIDAEKYNSALFALAFDQDGLIVYPLSYHPEHLHQLQNIYFWFTGEELNVRL